MTSLPLGRGARTGQNSYVGQNESYAQRRAAVVDEVADTLTPMSALVHAGSLGSAAVAATAEVLFLPLKRLQTDIELSQVRIKVDATAANSFLATALYVRSDRTKFAKVATSEARFDTKTSTGVLTLDLPQSTVLAKGTLPVIASVAEVGTPTLATYDMTASTGVAAIKSFSSSTLPTSVDWDSLTDSARVHVPFVAYLSADVSEFL